MTDQIAKLRMLVEGHLHCGDQYPEDGWPDIHLALAILDTMRESVSLGNIFKTAGTQHRPAQKKLVARLYEPTLLVDGKTR